MTHKEALKRALKELVEARQNLRNGQKNGVPPDQMAALREKVAYRETVVEALRPATIDREAWEPCLFCCEKNKGRKTLAFDSAGDAVTIEIDGDNAAIESDSMGFIVRFCPECGRPLTEEGWDMLEKRLRG